MAMRFVYLPISEKPFVSIRPVEFKWEPGMSSTQRKKSRDNLHNVIRQSGTADKILECSTLSYNDVGLSLSAFKLPYFADKSKTVESVYQGSKVFRNKYTNEEVNTRHLYNEDALTSKKFLSNFNYNAHELLRYSTDLEGVKIELPANTLTTFYDYIYIKSVLASFSESQFNHILKYEAFTDTQLKWYNNKVTACQAMSVAILVGLKKSGNLVKYMSTPEEFIKIFQ